MRDTYISVAHVSNRLGFDTFFTFILLLKMVSVMNENKKNRYLFDKNSQMIMMSYNYKINNLQITLYRSASSQMFYKIVDGLEGVLKDFANFAEKHLCRVHCERKSLTLSMQPAPSL